jgi:hypothetical protein
MSHGYGSGRLSDPVTPGDIFSEDDYPLDDREHELISLNRERWDMVKNPNWTDEEYQNSPLPFDEEVVSGDSKIVHNFYLELG